MRQGFTLIELLVVISILGTLAVVVLIAINPLQQIARTRDAGRISGVTQIGHALEAYMVSHNSRTPPNNNTWLQALVDGGELRNIPDAIGAGNGYSVCTRRNVHNWCYHIRTNPNCAFVYTALESDSYQSRCPSGRTAYVYYDTVDKRSGMLCWPDSSNPYARGGCVSWRSHSYFEEL